MHSIQRAILKSLTTKGKVRYRDLKPPGIEGNQFMYHLKTLIGDGLAGKEGIYYSLTAKGKRYADKVNLESFEIRSQPKIVTMLHIKNKKGEVLLFRRAKEPFLDLVSLPYGKVHLHERIAQAARRELSEKTGLSAELTHRGDAYITVTEGDDLVTQMLAHVFSGANAAGELKESTKAGMCFWGDPRTIRPAEWMPGMKEILDLMALQKAHFFEEYFLEI